MKTKIYGASDDLIEIEGAINDEHGCYDHKRPIKISVSDGTIATIFYDGNWGISVKQVGSLFKKIVTGNPAEDPHTDEDCKDCSPYSDVLVFNDGVEWVRISSKTYKP